MTPKQRAKKYRELAEMCFNQGDGRVYLGKRNTNVYPEANLIQANVIEYLETIAMPDKDYCNFKVTAFLFCEQMALEAES